MLKSIRTRLGDLAQQHGTLRAETAGHDAANGTMLAPNATSPRIVFDGIRNWTSYLDASGAVVVGYQDTNGVLRSTQLATTPRHDAYELAIVDYEPWIVALDASGLVATRLCTPESSQRLAMRVR